MKPFLLSTALSLLTAAPAFAVSCAARDDAVAIHRAAGQSRQNISLSTDGLVIERWVDAEGHWSLTATRPDGITCIIASGVGFTVLAEPHGDPA